MRTPVYTNRFDKDLKLMLKRGANPANLKSVIRKLIGEIPLERKYRDHLLVGNFKDHRGCHIGPDRLLVSRLDGSMIIFERTRTHTNLFK